MRVFGLAVFAAACVAFGAAVGLDDLVQKTAAQAYHTVGARLDQQEAVNFYGRQAEACPNNSDPDCARP